MYGLRVRVYVCDRGNNVSRVMSRLFVCGRVRVARHCRYATI